MTKKDRVISFVWQHVLLLVSLFIMTLGVAVCVRSMLGSSVISTLPYAFETAGKHLGWFDCMLAYRPGFRRYVYGLARYIYGKVKK